MFSMFRKHWICAILGSAMALGGGLLAGCSSGNAPAKIGTGTQTAIGKTPGTTVKTPGTITGTGTQTAGGAGGTTQGPAGAGTGDTSLSATAVKSVLDAADTQFSTIVNGTTDHDARNQQMAAWLQSRPEFAEAGVTAGDSVWGRLKNGHLYIATSTFIPGEDGRAASGRASSVMPARRIPATTFPFRRASASPTALHLAQRGVTRDTGGKNELPKVAQARVMISVDKQFYNSTNDQIADLLRKYNYNVNQQSPTVENLRTVQGDGVLYWIAHGDVSIDNRSKLAYWAVWTATDATDVGNENTYKADLDDGSLVYFNAAFGQDSSGVHFKTHYAITTKFIAKYNWSFAPNSFIFLNCCYSDYGSMVQDMAGRSGPVRGTYGWSNSVGVAAAYKAGAWAFDRLLGADKEVPADYPAQRAFDSTNVYLEMTTVGLDNGSVNGNTCQLVARDNGSPALAPSIERMEMSERLQESPLKGKSKLTLYGQFGSDKGTVKIGGVEVPIDTWNPDKIECEPADLPGPGFAGDVQVISQARPSNTVPLTQWHGKLTYTIDLLPPQVSDAVSTITCDVYFRGDVHKYRDKAGLDRLLSPRPLNFRASQGSTGRWVVTGSPPPMTTWSGPLSADLPFGLNGTVNPPYGTGYIVSGVIDADSGAVKFSFNFLNCVTGYAAAASGTPVATIHDLLLTAQGSGIGSDGYVLYSNNIPTTIGTDYIIAGSTLTGSTPIFEPKLTWTDFVPTYQPDDSKGEDNGH